MMDLLEIYVLGLILSITFIPLAVWYMIDIKDMIVRDIKLELEYAKRLREGSKG